MAQTDRFIIAPQGDGLQTDMRPWLIADTAYSQLDNAYVFRGRVRRRTGSKYLTPTSATSVTQQGSRLRLRLTGTTDPGTGNYTTTVPGSYSTAIGMAFSVNAGTLPEQFFTVISDAAGAQPMLSTGAATGTFESSTGIVTITGASTSALVYYYPAMPVMGFVQYQTGNISNLPTYAFDQQFAYQYTSTGWDILGPLPPAVGSAQWTGTNNQFFWGTTWRGVDNNANILFVTNFNTPDGIKYWNGTAWGTLAPEYDNAHHKILTARIIVPFKGYLVLLDTIEETASATSPDEFFNRARCCQNGSPFEANAWNQDVPGKGFFVDAPTKERIITAQFLKDHLIVFFEDSTWELVWSGNTVFPFYWQQINTELGAQSTFSEVPFDKDVLGIGRVGVHACNGTNVARIDEKIPDEVFNISRDNDGPQRVCGVRDYFLEMVYWSIPDVRHQQVLYSVTYPNRLLVYNYRNGTWSFFDDSITAFGYFEQQGYLTWGTASQQWGAASFAWVTPIENKYFKQIIAGNQEGYTFLMTTQAGAVNASALQITNIAAGVFTVMNHNLRTGDYIAVNNALGMTPSTRFITQVTVTGTDTFTISDAITGTYLGNGTIERITPIDIYTKQYNFYTKQGKNCFVPKVDFYLTKTPDGELTVDFFTSSQTTQPLNISGGATGTNALVGTSILESFPYTLVPYEQLQAQVWHPVYFQAEGENVQLRFHLSDAQIKAPLIADSDFELHAMIFYAQPVARLQ